MDVQIIADGTAPLLMHNPRMVDPDFAISREIKSIAGKRKKTDEDFRRIEDLEWWGGLYTSTEGDDAVVVQPTAKLRKSIIEAGRLSKLGKGVERALSFYDMNVPLIYEGSKDLKKLSRDAKFRSRLSVGIGPRRVMRCRPQFMPWRLVAKALFIEDAGLNFDELQEIVAKAGLVVGIGDNRVNGYGRYQGLIKKG